MAVRISEPNGIRDKGLLRSLQQCDWAVRRHWSYRNTPDAGLGRLTPTPEAPRIGRVNLGRRFTAGAAIHNTLRHVVATRIQPTLSDATVLLILTRR